MLASRSLHHGDDDDDVSRSVGHPHCLMLVSGRGLPGARVGVWGLDRAGVHPLTHHGDRDDDPVVVSHGRGRLCPWARRLAPVLRWRGYGWMWAGAPARSHSYDDDDDVIVIASVVGDGRGPGWDPVGVPG